jgi:hypothetical protein
MKNEDAVKIVFLVVIAGRKQKDAILTGLSKAGVRLTNTLYGKGTVQASYLKNLLGLVPEENKVMITGLISGEKSGQVMNMLMEKFLFDQPNTGIAFTIPIEKLTY